jgi:hypothetical protein
VLVTLQRTGTGKAGRGTEGVHSVVNHLTIGPKKS